MPRVSFRVPVEEKEELLDAVLPLLPAGVRERPAADGEVELATIAAMAPDRAALESAAGRELTGWRVEDVPADWRARRWRSGSGVLVAGGRVLVRSPRDPAPRGGVLDVVLERAEGGFGSGAHATTRMCLALLLDLDLEPAGAAADLGCGLGTLAIAAARLGWTPVVAVDRLEPVVAAARANGARNGVTVDWRVADLESAPVPLAPLLLVNAPPPVHVRVAAALDGTGRGAAARRAILSGVAAGEFPAVEAAYAAAGWRVAVRLDEDGWAAARLEPAGA